MSHPPPDTQIRIVYPKPEQPIYEASTFVMGQITPFRAEMSLLVNEQPVPVSGQGFFAWKVDLQPGMNPMVVEVPLPGLTYPEAQELFALYRVPPLNPLPAKPLMVQPETLLPQSDAWLSPADTLSVACLASVDARVSLLIEELELDPLPLEPIPTETAYLDNREAIFAKLHQTQALIPSRGYYRLDLPAERLFAAARSGDLLNRDLGMRLHLQSGETEKEVPLPGRVRLLAAWRSARVRTNGAVTRTFPATGARLTPQQAGTRLRVDGLRDGWARCRLSPSDVFYLSLEDLEFAEEQAAWPFSFLEFIHTEPEGLNRTEIRLTLSGGRDDACPIQVFPDRQGISVRLYQVVSRCDFIRFHPQDHLVEDILWQQIDESTVELHFLLSRPLSGLDYRYEDGAWRILAKALPRVPADLRVLIDPGHGGEEAGAIGLDGTPEKNLNLQVARYLQEALQAEGFKVALTRSGDETVSLARRNERALAEDADVVLSIHHNALPDGRDPLEHAGASTYYYHPFAKPLAEMLLASLAEPGGPYEIPCYGLLFDSLHMTRIHQAVAVLVEVGFFTHPQEYEHLIQPEFQQEVARRLARGLSEYCESLV